MRKIITLFSAIALAFTVSAQVTCAEKTDFADTDFPSTIPGVNVDPVSFTQFIEVKVPKGSEFTQVISTYIPGQVSIDVDSAYVLNQIKNDGSQYATGYDLARSIGGYSHWPAREDLTIDNMPWDEMDAALQQFGAGSLQDLFSQTFDYNYTSGKITAITNSLSWLTTSAPSDASASTGPDGVMCFEISGTTPDELDTFKLSYTSEVVYTLSVNGQPQDAPTDPAESNVYIVTIDGDGVESLSTTKFDVAQNVPNPTAGNTNVEFYAPNNGKVYFSVYNMLGKVVNSDVISANRGLNNYTFDVSTYETGVYFYSMTLENKKVVRRLVVSRN